LKERRRRGGRGPKEKTVPVHVRLPLSTYDAYDELARATKRSLSAVLRDVLLYHSPPKPKYLELPTR